MQQIHIYFCLKGLRDIDQCKLAAIFIQETKSVQGGELYLCEHRCRNDGLTVQRLLQIVMVLRVLTLKIRKQTVALLPF